MTYLLQSKRKVEDDDDIETRSPRRSHRDLSDPPSPISHRVAENGSIYSIIRRNSRRALYVEPIAWTSDHLQSLNCSFNRQRLSRKGREYIQDNTSEEPEDGTTGSPENAARLKWQLTQVSTLTVKKYAIKEILEAYSIRPQGSEDLSFRFNHQNVANLPTDGVFMSSDPLSSIAFVTFDTIKSLRESYIRPKKTTNIPILNKTRSKLRLLEPRDRAEDPYLVAVLIALAQTQRRQQQPSQLVNTTTNNAWSRIDRQTDSNGGKMPSEVQSFKVKVLAIPGTRAKHFYVYTATIPTEFLDKFEEPLRYTPSSPISVSYYRIAVNDGRSLERLHWLLYADSCV